MPLLVRVDPHDLVAEVAVLAADVRVRVVDVVVRVLPRLRRRGGVPVPGRGVDLGIVHPVPLAVHHVVADLHVLEDLGQRQRRRAGDPGRPVARGEQQHPAEHDQPAVHLDHARDVAAVAIAELGEDLVVDRVELAAELPRSARRSGGPAGSRSGRGHGVPRCRVQRSISIAPSGALMQVRTISPSCRGPRRCAGRGPGRSTGARRRCGRCPCGSRTAASAPASSPATRIGCAPSDSRLDAARAGSGSCRRRRCSPSPTPTTGWKRSMCRRSRVAVAASQCSVIASSISAGPQRNVSRSRQSGHSSVQVGRASSGPCSPVMLLVQPVAGRALGRARAARRRRSRRRPCARSAGARRRAARRRGRGCAACS